MAATYGSLPPSEGSDVEMVLDDTIVRQPEQKSFFALAMKTSLAVLLFAGISIMAVSVSRSYDGLTSNQASVEFDTDVFGRVTYSLLTDEQQESLFNDFISTYNRDYAQQAEEYEKRLAVFKTNLALADVRNAKEAAINGSGVHGVTKFSDLTSEEFVSTYLMQETSESAERRKNRRSRKAEESETPNRIAGSDPTLIYVDWTDDTTTDVKNMGSCGGSWAIAAVEQIESDAIKEGIISADRPLSAQQLLSCVSGQQGCTYGSIEDAYENVKKPGGSYFASDYPYTSSEGDVPDCVTVEKNYALTIGGYFSLNTDGNTYNTERLILNHVTNDGTLSACLDATTWSTYVSGTMGSCDGNEINHCIQIVGVYYSSAEDTGFYKIRNSWGTDWGVNGYISLAYGDDLCAVTNNPIYTDPVKDTTTTSAVLTTTTTTKVTTGGGTTTVTQSVPSAVATASVPTASVPTASVSTTKSVPTASTKKTS